MSGENVLSFLEDRIIQLQTRINEMQELSKHYKMVLKDYKREHKIETDMPEHVNMNQHEHAPAEHNHEAVQL